MTIDELSNTLVDVHNLISRVSVSGENTLLVGDSIRTLRAVIKSLVENGIDIQNERVEDNDNETKDNQ